MAIERPSRPYPDLSWSGWGDPALAMTLPEAMLKLLADGLGVRGGGQPVGSLAGYTLPPSRLSDAAVRRLSCGRRIRARRRR